MTRWSGGLRIERWGVLTVPPLSEEDARLAEDDVDRLDKLSKVRRVKSEAATVEVPWLRRTEYIANVLAPSTPVAVKPAEKCVGARSPGEAGRTAGRGSRCLRAGGLLLGACGVLRPVARPATPLSVEDEVKAIEQTFLDAQQVPKHPTNPSLHPLEVLPIFPDFDLWGIKCVGVVGAGTAIPGVGSQLHRRPPAPS